MGIASPEEPRVGMVFESALKMESWIDSLMKKRRELYSRKTFSYIDRCDEAYNVLKYKDIDYRCVHGGAQHRPKTSPTKRLRQSRTLKVDCPFCIKLRATKDRQYLAIVDVNLCHKNHVPSSAMLEYYPQNRKLDTEEQRETVKTWLEMGVTKPVIRQKLLREFNKCSAIKDLYNIEAKLKANKREHELETAIQFLKNKGADVSILKDGNNFKGLYFSTPDMKSSMKHYPEIVFIDGTYKLLDNDLTLVLILVEDSNGSSNIVAAGLLASETILVVRWFLNTFKINNEDACKNVKCFMADKDAVYRGILKQLFVGVPVYICLFHSLQAMKRALTRSSIKVKSVDHDVIMQYFKQLAYSHCEEEYMAHYKEFCQNVPPQVKDYFNKNWHYLRDEWTIYNMTNSNFLNVTNNRLESVNQKIKRIVGKRNSLLTFLEKFFIFLSTKDMQVDFKAALNFMKVHTQYKNGSIEQQYSQLLTDYAYAYVSIELSEHIYTKVETESQRQQYFVKTKYTTYNVSPDKCECSTWESLLLPCRHIFALRKVLNISLFDKNLCKTRWTKDYYLTTQRLFSKVDDSTQSRTSQTLPLVCVLENPGVETGEGRKSIIEPLMRHLIHVVSNSCGSTFYYRLGILRSMKCFWEDGFDVLIEYKKIVSSLSESFTKLEMTDANKTVIAVPRKRQMVLPITTALTEVCISLINLDAFQKKLQTLKQINDLFDKNVSFTLVNITSGKSNNTFLASQQLKNMQIQLSTNDSNVDHEEVSRCVMPSRLRIKGHPRHSLTTTPTFSKKKKIIGKSSLKTGVVKSLKLPSATSTNPTSLSLAKSSNNAEASVINPNSLVVKKPLILCPGQVLYIQRLSENNKAHEEPTAFVVEQRGLSANTNTSTTSISLILKKLPNNADEISIQ